MSLPRASCDPDHARLVGPERPVLRVADDDGVLLALRLLGGRDERGRGQALDRQHRDVERGVEQHDGGVDRPAVDLDLRLADPGDDVGVRHDPLGGVDEAAALDALAAGLGHARHLQDARLDRLDHRALAQRRVRRVDARLVGRLQVGEDLREAALVDEVAELAEEPPAGVGHQPVDGRHDRRAPHLRRELGVGRGRDGAADQPGDEQQAEHADDRAAGGVEPARRAPRQPPPQGAADHGREHLPDRGGEEDDRQADGGAREADERVELGDPRGDPRAEHPAAEEADERQDADDEPLPVAREREQHRGHDEHDVEGDELGRAGGEHAGQPSAAGRAPPAAG